MYKQTKLDVVCRTNKKLHFRSLFNIRRWPVDMRLYLAIFLMIMTINADDILSRTERQVNGIPLVYPYGAIYKLLVGFASPVATKDKTSLLFGVNFQYQYAQFINISQLSQYYLIKTVSRESRDVGLERGEERLALYRSMAELMSTKGMSGPSCVLRAICEAAQFPVDEEGLVGEILHVLLTPDYGRTPFDDEPDLADTWPEMSPYVDAALTGRQMFSCADIYDNCPEGEGLMELISTLRDD